MTRDPRIGRDLWDVLNYNGQWALEDDVAEAARASRITAISHSPKRKRYQIAVVAPSGKSVTEMVPEWFVRSELEVARDA
jgi:hypothetical protein